MMLSARRPRIAAAALAICGTVAAIAIAGSGAATAASAQGRRVVLVTCANRAVVRPSSYVLACADANDYLTGVFWVHWTDVGFARGTEVINGCQPTCARGIFYRYPVLITAWRAMPRPRHPGQWYLSRLTITHTGDLRRPHAPPVPLTVTWYLPGNF
jgi:hypothetical protein